MRAKVAFLVSAAFAPAAHAGFYVTDAPVPVTVRPAAQPVASESTATYKVSFASRSSQISWTAKRSLGAILTSLQDATKITISGCGEAHGGDALAYRRGAAIKAWLIDNGISPDAVDVATQTDSHVIRSGKQFSCAVVSSAETTPYQQLFGSNAPAPVAASYTSAPAPAPATVASPSRQGVATDTQIAMIRQVLDMVSRKVLKPDDAVAMMQEIMKGQDRGQMASPQSAPSSMPPVYAPDGAAYRAQPRMQYVSARVEPAPVVAPMPAIAAAPSISVEPAVQTWTFVPGGSLKDTLGTWAKQAGWNVPDWRPANPYQASGEPITGSFFDALRAICGAAPGLDIKADPQKRDLIVTSKGE